METETHRWSSWSFPAKAAAPGLTPDLGVSALGGCVQRATCGLLEDRRGARPCQLSALGGFLFEYKTARPSPGSRVEKQRAPASAAPQLGQPEGTGRRTVPRAGSSSPALRPWRSPGPWHGTPAAAAPVGGLLEASSRFPLQPDLWPQLALALLVQLTEQNRSEARNCSQLGTLPSCLLGRRASRAQGHSLLLTRPAQPCLQQLLTWVLLLLGYKSPSDVGDNRGFPVACGGLSHPLVWARG